MYALTDYSYHLPESLIAQEPMVRRDQSRLLCLGRTSGRIDHRRFGDILEVLNPGDVLVLNNTRVINGRLLGRKASGGKVEVLILNYAQGAQRNLYECMVRASRRPRVGSRMLFGRDLEAQVVAVNPSTCTLSFGNAMPLDQALETIGHVPLPPYIRRDDAPRDRNTYQTVYAQEKGAIAAPTAGLHFTPELLRQLKTKGVVLVYLTLHVGYGTFVPVRAADIREHRMHAEWFTLGEDVANAIHRAKDQGTHVVAVGTTCVRTLEHCTSENGRIEAQSGMCDLFIYPGYRFKTVDAVITNFHLPRSTLLMLVSAFAGREKVLSAYREAVRKKYRFYSYGDAMMIS